mmetsp:Transcript_9668/g.18145  ORF Transcript_9668/g.18145 Transcript_9668/m.18145 type:complete len:403 (-) Transcript_9668:1869-3077(-)
MKVITLLAAINCGALAFAPQARTTGTSRYRTNLDASREQFRGENAMGGIAAFLVGLVTAGQVAIAEPPAIIKNTLQTGASSTIISIGAPSFSAGSSFDTLDFSLPSYEEATKGGDISSTSKSAPAFTADFPDFKLPREEVKKEAAVDEAAIKKAADDEKAAKAKAKEEARLAKEKEAAEKAAAEEKKKAELAARREAEKKKQEEMVARQRAAEEKAAMAAKVSEESSSVPVKNVEVVPPPAPKPAPAVSVPEVSVPEFKMPEFSAPDIKVPSFSAPKFEVPKMEAPKFEVPAAPMSPLPKPSPSSYDLDVKAPPSVPSFSTSAPTVKAEPLESQEVRDAKARDAKEKFKNLDDEAKVFEKKAQEARELAKAAKKEAKIAKDEACETRPGGKVLCIRPFAIGY